MVSRSGHIAQENSLKLFKASFACALGIINIRRATPYKFSILFPQDFGYCRKQYFIEQDYSFFYFYKNLEKDTLSNIVMTKRIENHKPHIQFSESR